MAVFATGLTKPLLPANSKAGKSQSVQTLEIANRQNDREDRGCMRQL